MVDLGKIGITFRPVISYNQSTMPDIARASFLCATHVLASDYFQLSSLTIEGNQILSQSGIAIDKPRNLFMNYYNSLKKTKRHSILGDENYAATTMPLTGG